MAAYRAGLISLKSANSQVASLGEAEKVASDVSDCVRQVEEIAGAMAGQENSFSDDNLAEVEAELEELIRNQADEDDLVQKMKELDVPSQSSEQADSESEDARKVIHKARKQALNS